MQKRKSNELTEAIELVSKLEADRPCIACDCESFIAYLANSTMQFDNQNELMKSLYLICGHCGLLKQHVLGFKKTNPTGEPPNYETH
jgi:hypothetical protein